jgi:hypothetical protein
VLSDIYHLKRDNAVKYTKKNDNIRPFESGGESSLEFFSLKTDCSLIVVSEIISLFYNLIWVLGGTIIVSLAKGVGCIIELLN